MKLQQCTYCGAPKLLNVDGGLKCPYCNSFFTVEKVEAIEDKLSEAEKKGKDANIPNTRALLLEELGQSRPNIASILHYCDKIRTVFPDDAQATFFAAYYQRKSFPGSYETALENLGDADLIDFEIKTIADVAVPNCDFRCEKAVRYFLKQKGVLDQYESAIKKALEQRKAEADLFDPEKDIFVCHSSVNIEETIRIVKELEDDGYSCWHSERNLVKNDDKSYWLGINNAIKACPVFLVIGSDASMTSPDCQRELDIAKEMNKALRVWYKVDEGKATTKFKKFFDGVNWIDASNGQRYDELKERIYDLLNPESVQPVIAPEISEQPSTPVKEEKAEPLPADSEIKEPVIEEKKTEEPKKEEAKIGSIIKLGSRAGTELEWIILDKDDEKMLLMSKSILDVASMYETRYDSNSSWRDSMLRANLNANFLVDYKIDKEDVVEVSLDNSPASTCLAQNPYATEETLDRVFLLSKKEVRAYCNEELIRIADISMAPKSLSVDGSYWTRSPNKDRRHFFVIDAKGEESLTKKEEQTGIRPCIYVYTEEAKARMAKLKEESSKKKPGLFGRLFGGKK